MANLIVRSAGYESTLNHIIQCLDDKFSHSETDDCLLQEFHQMQQGNKEGVLEYGSKLECKFRFLQERFPDRYDDSQLLDRFFSSVVNRTCDAIHHKHDNPESTFNELLTAAMKAEAEATQRSAQAKAFNAETDTDTNPEIISIQKQLTNMTDIIKSARFQDRDHKKKGGNTAKAAEIRENQQTTSCHLYYYSSGFNKVTLQSTHWSIQTLPISGGDSSCSWVFYSCTGPKCGVGVDLVDCNAVGGGHVATSIDQSVRISACGALALEEYKQSASVQPLLCSS